MKMLLDMQIQNWMNLEKSLQPWMSMNFVSLNLLKVGKDLFFYATSPILIIYHALIYGK